MNDTQSSLWFSDTFSQLDPLLQTLHLKGGKLSGPVCITIADGIAGRLGRKLARKLGIPTDNKNHSLQVNISHCDDGLHWDRCFDNTNEFKSVFKPVGNYSNGYWLEDTGELQLQLTVDIKDGGWYWCCEEIRVHGLKTPNWLLPKTTAYKTVENGSYRFYVGLSVPVFGTLLSYNGLLDITT